MITRVDGPAKTLSGLIAYAKAHPGKLNFGVPNGAPPHMLAAGLRSVTGTDIVIVPYRGASTVITDLMGGQVDLGFETTSVTFGNVRAGKIRALGVATAARLPDLTEVPTMIESGVPDFTASPWTGIMAPACATPRPIVRPSSTRSSTRASSRRSCRRDSSSSAAIADPDAGEILRPSSPRKTPSGRPWPSLQACSRNDPNA